MMDGFIQLFHAMAYKLHSWVDELELWLVWDRETMTAMSILIADNKICAPDISLVKEPLPPTSHN